MNTANTWGISKFPDNKFAVVNIVYTGVDIDVTVLLAALQIVTEEAGKMEEKLTKKGKL